MAQKIMSARVVMVANFSLLQKKLTIKSSTWVRHLNTILVLEREFIKPILKNSNSQELCRGRMLKLPINRHISLDPAGRHNHFASLNCSYQEEIVCLQTL